MGILISHDQTIDGMERTHLTILTLTVFICRLIDSVPEGESVHLIWTIVEPRFTFFSVLTVKDSDIAGLKIFCLSGSGSYIYRMQHTTINKVALSCEVLAELATDGNSIQINNFSIFKYKIHVLPQLFQNNYAQIRIHGSRLLVLGSGHESVSIFLANPNTKEKIRFFLTTKTVERE